MAKTRIANIFILAVLLAVVCFGVSRAQFNGCPAGFCNTSAGSTPPVACDGGLQNADNNCIINADGSFIKAAS